MPSPVDKYFDKVKEQNPTYSDAQAWATAWSIYCKYKNPGSEHCHLPTGEYFKGKEAMGLRVAAKIEIPVPNDEMVIAVGKEVYSSGSVKYWYQLKKSKAKMSYTDREKFRYQLRNQAQVVQANKLVEELDAKLPSLKKEALVPLREFEDALIADKVASRFRVAEEDEGASSKDEKRGEFNLYIRKGRATRWDYSLHNPEGGSAGSSSYPSIKAAIAAAIGRGVRDPKGKDRVWVIIQVWDSDKEDYVTKKTYWEPLSEAGK